VYQVIRATSEHPLYEQTRDLRQRVLLGPRGLSIERVEQAFPDNERNLTFFLAVLKHPKGDRVVGCVALRPHYPQPGLGRLTQMAVDPQLRGQGIGRRLVVELERHAFADLGLTEVCCHAPSDAEGFYSALGWQPQGEPFDELGISHRRLAVRG